MKVSRGVNFLLLSTVAATAYAIPHARTRSGVGTPLIIKGDAAGAGDFPHIVQLHLLSGGEPYNCGGSIIAPNLVLTAAHCVEDFVNSVDWKNNPLFSIKVVAGALDYYAYFKEDHSQRRSVVGLVRHENFSMDTLNNDVAILALSHPLNYTRYVQPIQLPKHGQVFEGLADICGWGYRQNNEPNYKPGRLRKARVHLHDAAFCKQVNMIWGFEYDEETTVCAGGAEADTCHGDSGGPLICDSGSGAEKGKVLCGITSWGEECGTTGEPGMFTRVSTYTPWIQKQVAELSNPCRPGQFYCGSHIDPASRPCIPLSSACNGHRDCFNGVDEVDCNVVEDCPTGFGFRCGSGECVPARYACDLERDCFDGSDEVDVQCRPTTLPTPLPSACSNMDFKCDDGTCISKWYKCDSIRDCFDGSDEDAFLCDDRAPVGNPGTTPTPPPCGWDTFRCSNGQCIVGRFRCDGATDCLDSSDELDCAHHTCNSTEFRCTVGHCIPLAQKCDNELDCTDQSDELNATCWDSVCGPSKHKCDTGQCLDTLLFCDGHLNCVDGSDEKEAFCEDYWPRVYSASASFDLHTSAQLKCWHVGWLLPELNWLKDGNVITDEARLEYRNTDDSFLDYDSRITQRILTLLFPNVSLADEGDYACRLGSGGHEVHVSVYVSEVFDWYDEGEQNYFTRTTRATPEALPGWDSPSENIEPGKPGEVYARSAGGWWKFTAMTLILFQATFGLVLFLAGVVWKLKAPLKVWGQVPSELERELTKLVDKVEERPAREWTRGDEEERLIRDSEEENETLYDRTGDGVNAKLTQPAPVEGLEDDCEDEAEEANFLLYQP